MNNSCEIMKDKITDYVLGILNENEIANLEEHIEQCSECKEHLESLQKERETLLQLGENIDSTMNEREKSVIAALEKVSNKQSVKPTFFNSRVFRFAAAAIIAIALLIPLSYGANNLIKRLVAGSVQYDDYKGDFALDKDIRVELQVGNKEKQNIVSASNIRFFVEDNEIRGTLRIYFDGKQEFRWSTNIELYDLTSKNIASTEHVSKNTSAQFFNHGSYPCAIHFTLGKINDISMVQKFVVAMKETSDDQEITPDAWYESEKLNIIRGRVTGPDGKPIANAEIQIRQAVDSGRRQGVIMAPDVITDERGFYSYDNVNWPYYVGVVIEDNDSNKNVHKHQYKRLNKKFEGSQTVDFEFGEISSGSSSVFGTVRSSGGKIIKEFRVNISSHIDWDDYSGEYSFQFGYRIPFVTEDGKFEINNLPAGMYDVTIYPSVDEILAQEDFLNGKKYVCELQENQRLEIGIDNSKGQYLYGRVLFNDGTPAVPDLNDFKTQIAYWHQDSDPVGLALASLDTDGYFAVQIPDEAMESLKSGKAILTAFLAQPDMLYEFQRGDVYPIDFLSSQRDNVKPLQINKPNIYYGKIIYDNGKSALPKIFPTSDYRMYISVRLQSATQRILNFANELCKVDKDGYFAAYFTDEEFEKYKTNQYSIKIGYPSYTQMHVYYSISYPFEMLSTEKEKVEGYNILTDKSMEYENLSEVLESIEKLKELFTALEAYAKSNNRNYPGIMGFADIETEDLQWLFQNVEYFPVMKSQDVSESAKTVIAYDKTLLEKYDATLVLFRDGHIEYCWPRELEILGIKKAEVEQLP